MNNFDKFLKEFEDYLNKITISCDTDYSVLTDAMRYSLLDGGKRIRPYLLYRFYKLCGGCDDNLAFSFAAAIEMIHTYSLIHDDLPCMDNDDYRRGRLSNHKKFGEDIALLAGDALLTEAFYIASCAAGSCSDAFCLKAINRLSFYAGYRGMVGGQVIDLSSEGKAVSAELINKLNLLKTGALLKAACEIGCILAGGDEICVSSAKQYGENIGLAFQLVDDVLDSTADEKLLGKPVGSDAKNNKSTFISVFGIDKCKSEAKNLTEAAIKALDNFSGDSAELKQIAYDLLNRKF